MSWRRITGKTKVLWLPKTSANAIPAKTAVYLVAGRIAKYKSDTVPMLGVSQDSFATTDTGIDLMAVEVPIEKYVEWEVDVSTTTLADTDIGQKYDLDTDGEKMVLANTTDKTVLVTRKIATDKAAVVIFAGLDNFQAL